MLTNKLLGAAAAAVPQYIEDVFSTYLYTGTGASQTITNNIDLSTKGGLVWFKDRSTTFSHNLYDTARGTTKAIFSNVTDAQSTIATGLTAFNTNGFSIGSNAAINTSSNNLVSWTFREQEKFFDIVTWTGNGTSPRAISHSLGSVPGCIIAKSLSYAGNWFVYHRSIGATKDLRLNGTESETTTSASWGDTAPTSTQFTVGGNSNVNNETYVAYLFAHDAGGFGASGTDNVISCGSFTTDGSGNATVTLGYEPQLVIWKAASGSTPTGNWWIADNMRGFSQTGMNTLYANTSAAENVFTTKYVCPTATGFELVNGFENPTTTYIYIAIRRPMKTPTSGTSVFVPTTFTGVDALQTSNFPVDFLFEGQNLAGTIQWYWMDRLRGADKFLESNATSAESTQSGGIFTSNTQVRASDDGNSSKRSYQMFRRAPGFFDVVCDTGTASGHTINHGLGVVPELMIRKKRNSATNSDWIVWHTLFSGTNKYLFLNQTDAEATNAGFWTSTAPTSTVFSVGTGSRANNLNDTYVTYLFATVAGVSKVGSYTGTGTTLTIDCGFTAGARFVLIKRTSSTGDWYVWDTARGIISGNDPYLLLNSTAAEVTNTDYIDPVNSGFQISSTAPVQINQSGGTFIFLAIA